MPAAGALTVFLMAVDLDLAGRRLPISVSTESLAGIFIALMVLLMALIFDRARALAEELDSQFDQSRMQNAMSAMGGMGSMPPPPPENDTGFTEEELTEQLSEIGSSDSQRASLISNIVENFDAADTDGDGKVRAFPPGNSSGIHTSRQ